MIIRIPKVFYNDCVDCETLVPPIVHETKAHYFIDTGKGDVEASAEETISDFISRADYYSENFGFDEWTKKTICPSARATLAAIKKAEAA
tara:strand:- start:60 stop:329 length:270 start_codon:yes stop_codon:yes gene_type:complete